MGKYRFVLLEHFQAEGSHFDLMLEDDDHLLTWRLPRLPAAGETLEVEKSSDHRLLYLDYEGPIGGDRGHVVRRDAGTYERRNWDTDLIQVRLLGGLLRGDLAMKPDAQARDEEEPLLARRASWVLTYTA